MAAGEPHPRSPEPQKAMMLLHQTYQGKHSCYLGQNYYQLNALIKQSLLVLQIAFV